MNRPTTMSARRALVIDDDEAVREVARASLELMAGWEVLAADSGSAGLALASAARPDVILVDVIMPEMDGVATVAALRATPATRDIPIILLTAVAQDDEPDRFRGLGVAGVIAKPFDALHLADAVAATLDWDR
ncbi:MAG TPA: response regulator [Chloroflexota bacterium]|nr:response regulator [Chloroflexota bacterium]